MAAKKNYWTYEDSKRIINDCKDKTAWFNGEVKFDDMWTMLRFRMGFGENETAVILASLIRNGAKFS